MSLPSARTRRTYADDLLGWQEWLAERGLEIMGAGRVHVDLSVRAQQAQGAGDASVRRRGWRGRGLDPDYTVAVGLSRPQDRALIVPAGNRGHALVRPVPAGGADSLSDVETVGFGPAEHVDHRRLDVPKQRPLIRHRGERAGAGRSSNRS